MSDGGRPGGGVAAGRGTLAVAVAGRPWHVAVGAVATGLALSQTDVALSLAAAAALLACLALTRAPMLAVVGAMLLMAGTAAGAARLDALERASPLIDDGRSISARAHLLTRARASVFGSSAVARVASGPLAGTRVLLRFDGRDGSSLPGRAAIGDELLVGGRMSRSASDPDASFDFAAHLRRERIAGELLVERVRLTGARRGGMAGALDGLRRRAEEAVIAGLPEADAALALGMVLGEDEGIDSATRDDWRDSGLSHLLAVSGQNVMLLIALALPLLVAAGLGPRGRGVALLCLVALYMPLAGAGPSLQRAGVMGAAGIAAMTLSRPSSHARAATPAGSSPSWRWRVSSWPGTHWQADCDGSPRRSRHRGAVHCPARCATASARASRSRLRPRSPRRPWWRTISAPCRSRGWLPTSWRCRQWRPPCGLGWSRLRWAWWEHPCPAARGWPSCSAPSHTCRSPTSTASFTTNFMSSTE